MISSIVCKLFLCRIAETDKDHPKYIGFIIVLTIPPSNALISLGLNPRQNFIIPLNTKQFYIEARSSKRADQQKQKRLKTK